jgi:hypothetical protein
MNKFENLDDVKVVYTERGMPYLEFPKLDAIQEMVKAKMEEEINVSSCEVTIHGMIYTFHQWLEEMSLRTKYSVAITLLDIDFVRKAVRKERVERIAINLESDKELFGKITDLLGTKNARETGLIFSVYMLKDVLVILLEKYDQSGVLTRRLLRDFPLDCVRLCAWSGGFSSRKCKALRELYEWFYE